MKMFKKTAIFVITFLICIISLSITCCAIEGGNSGGGTGTTNV